MAALGRRAGSDGTRTGPGFSRHQRPRMLSGGAAVAGEGLGKPAGSLLKRTFPPQPPARLRAARPARVGDSSSSRIADSRRAGSQCAGRNANGNCRRQAGPTHCRSAGGIGRDLAAGGGPNDGWKVGRSRACAGDAGEGTLKREICVR